MVIVVKRTYSFEQNLSDQVIMSVELLHHCACVKSEDVDIVVFSSNSKPGRISKRG